MSKVGTLIFINTTSETKSRLPLLDTTAPTTVGLSEAAIKAAAAPVLAPKNPMINPLVSKYVVVSSQSVIFIRRSEI